MLTLGPIGFLQPALLAALLALPLIWWLLRFTPPRPRLVVFPPTRLLKDLDDSEQTPRHSPWWLTALRMLLAALLILALARPVLHPDREALGGSGPLLLVVDNGWASAGQWRERETAIEALLARAERDGRSITLAATADGTGTLVSLGAEQARQAVANLAPRPYAPRRLALLERLQRDLAGRTGFAVVWLSDGLDYGNAGPFAAGLEALASDGGQLMVARPPARDAALGVSAEIGAAKGLAARVVRAEGAVRTGTVHALSARSERLGEATFQFASGDRETTAAFDLPLEIRNQVARLEIADVRSAGAVHLLDARSRWRRVGVVSGESRETAQPLLSPLYYVERALDPYVELAAVNDSNIATAVRTLVERNLSVLVLADIGTLVGSAFDEIEAWVERGGTLIRFAGPRLEQAGDELLPTPLRRGGRTLGGSLSWSTPQPLAPFEQDSPFFGLATSDEVTVRRQVLADPGAQTAEVWARLQDGTPLVSAARRGDGWIVLFHVTANSDWSNLPMSGLFVEMLRRIVDRSSATTARPRTVTPAPSEAAPPASAPARGLLPPVQVLDGFGQLVAPTAAVAAVKAEEIDRIAPGPEHPPGYYGPAGAVRALNAVTAGTMLEPLAALPRGTAMLSYSTRPAFDLKPWLLAAAVIVFLADMIAILLLSSGLRVRPFARAAASLLIALALGLGLAPTPAVAQSQEAAQSRDNFLMEAALNTRLAYVITGDPEVDRTSEQGLTGLGKVLAARTAVEPATPLGVNVDTDELAFFPLLYWPVLTEAQALSDATLARIDAFMKQGGMIVFDTRDYHLSLPGRAAQASGETALSRLLGKLDIPPLQPVPEGHVLTKSFYLLTSFPGRWDGGPMWVEAVPESEQDRSERARQSDGVSSIMITSNDLAAAWALDDSNQPLYPVVPGGEMQREMAFRVGVNIVMYALTGNYKADQVHVPALLERLGQ